MAQKFFYSQKIQSYLVLILGCVIASFLLVQAINFLQDSSDREMFRTGLSTEKLDAIKEKYQSLKEEDRARFKEAAKDIYQGLSDAQKEDVKKYIQKNPPELRPH